MALENFVPGIYVGEATKEGGLILHLVKEAGKIAGPIDRSLPIPFSESGFCSQEELENYYNKQAVYA